jgi:hypothetical protein
MELLDKAKDSVAREVGQRDGARQPRALAHGRDSKGAGHRQAIVAIPTGMERGVPSECPGATQRGLEHEASLINANTGAALTPGFFSAGASLQWAIGHGLVIVLTCTSGGFLWTPRTAAQQAPDTRGTIGDAKVTRHQDRHTPQGPELMTATMGVGALA